MVEYNVKSEQAAEFINDAEIRATIEYAEAHATDIALCREILSKAAEGGGLNHRDATLLLACNDKEIIEELFSLARTALPAGEQQYLDALEDFAQEKPWWWVEPRPS
jgi:2-iminoacetate synthase